MSQTRLHSLVESGANIGIGYALSVAAGVIIYPLFDSSITLADNAGITAIFTALSFTRTYITRRVFNWMHIRKPMD